MNGFDHARKAPEGFTWINGIRMKDHNAEGRRKARANRLSVALKPLTAIRPVLESRYLVKGWLDRGALSVVYGESNVGKTFFALDLALHIAARRNWHGAKVAQDVSPKPGPVIYIAGEGGVGINNRIEAVRQSDRALIEAAGQDFMLLPTCIDLCGEGDAQALFEVGMYELDCTPSLIVVDTLARAMGDGDENSAKDMGALVRNADYLRERLGCHVLIVHHSGKDTTKGARGSGSLRAAVDTEIELVRDDEITVATTRKQRDMPTDASFAYTLRGVSIGFDEDGDRVSSAVLEKAEKPERKTVKRKALNGRQKTALEALREVIGKHGEKKSGPDYPGQNKVVPVDIWREECDRRGLVDSDNRDSKRRVFNSARTGLLDAEYIAQFDGFVWLADKRDNRDKTGTEAGQVPVPERDGTGQPPYRGASSRPVTPTPDPEDEHHPHDQNLDPEDWR